MPMDPNTIISDLDDYSRKTGLKPPTICQYALGDARLYERLKKRSEKLKDQAERLRAYMAANPPKASEAEDAA